MGKKLDAFSIMKSRSVHEEKGKERKRKLSCGATSEQACKKTKSDDSSIAKVFQMSWLEELKLENRTMFCSLCILHKKLFHWTDWDFKISGALMENIPA